MDLITINGKNNFIYDNADIINVVRENLGDELADIIEKKIVAFDFEKAYAEQKAMTDAGAWEAEVENITHCLNDISDNISEFQESIEDKKRVTRNEFEGNLNDILRTIKQYGY